jgi:hypothetical protein
VLPFEKSNEDGAIKSLTLLPVCAGKSHEKLNFSRLSGLKQRCSFAQAGIARKISVFPSSFRYNIHERISFTDRKAS